MSNCTIDYIKTCNNNNIGIKISLFILLMIFPYFFSVFINIHEYAKYATMITCIFDNGIKDLCLSFYDLVQILSNLWLTAAEILLKLYIYHHL